MFTYILGYWWFYYSRQLILLNKADDCRYWSTKLFNIFVKHFINFRGNNDVSTISKPVICNFYIFILIESTFYSTIYFRKKGLILFVFLVFSFSFKHFNNFEKIGWLCFTIYCRPITLNTKCKIIFRKNIDEVLYKCRLFSKIKMPVKKFVILCTSKNC